MRVARICLYFAAGLLSAGLLCHDAEARDLYATESQCKTLRAGASDSMVYTMLEEICATSRLADALANGSLETTLKLRGSVEEQARPKSPPSSRPLPMFGAPAGVKHLVDWSLNTAKTSPETFETLLSDGTLDPPQDQVVVAVQEVLARMGCYRGRFDGDWGRGTQRAFGAYLEARSKVLPARKDNGINFGALPNLELYRALLRDADLRCPDLRVPAQSTGSSAPRFAAPGRSSSSSRITTPTVAAPRFVPWPENLTPAKLDGLRQIVAERTGAGIDLPAETLDRAEQYLTARDRRDRLFEDLAQVDPEAANDLLRRLLGGGPANVRPAPPASSSSSRPAMGAGGIFR